MRPGHRDDFGSKLALIGIPQERVTLLDAPQSGRLAARDVEMQMRPPSTAAFLAKHTNFLPYADWRTGAHRGINGLEMTVAIVPTPIIEQINHVVARFHRAVVVAR